MQRTIKYWWERGHGWQWVVTDDYGGGYFEIVSDEGSEDSPVNAKRFKMSNAAGLERCLAGHYPEYTITQVKGD